MNYSDNILGEVKPSQWINYGWYIFGIVSTVFLYQYGSWGLSPLLIVLWKYLEIYFWRYEFREETIVERKGILNVTRNEIHYYRIKSVQVNEPLIYRIVDIGDINIITSDQFTENFTFKGVDNVLGVKDYIRQMIYNHRGRKGVKEFDMYHL